MKRSAFSFGTGALCCSLLTGCSEPDTAQSDRARNIHTVQRSDLTTVVSEQGEVHAASNTRVMSKLEKRTTLIYLIPEASVVEEGDLLAEFDVSEIEEKRANQQIGLAKTEAAVVQAQKNFEIMGKQLEADVTTAVSRSEIANIRKEKFLGRAPETGANPTGSSKGTNREMLEELRRLIEAESIEDPDIRTKYGSLPNMILSLLGSETNQGLEAGNMANQVLKQIDRISLARADLKMSEDTVTHSRRLADLDFITKTELERDEINYQRQTSNVKVAWSDLQLLINYTLRESRISLDQEIANAELNVESVSAGNDARRVREASQLVSVQAEMELAQERLANSNRQIQNAVITAPTPGLVVYGREGVFKDPAHEGMSVRPRQTIINLPNVNHMVARLKVHEAQVNTVAVNQPANIRLDAFPDRIFSGRVGNVSSLPDSASRWTNKNLKVYLTTIAVDGGNHGGILRPGMTATIEIHVGTREDVINIPITAIQRSGDTNYVWKVTSEGPAPTPISTGSNNLSHVEILAGLVEGDRIHLVQPDGVQLPEYETRGPGDDIGEELPAEAKDASADSGQGTIREAGGVRRGGQRRGGH